ncbi:TIM barrel protein [Streptomyces sp. 2131.1]|uniref:TIM barrel protein n=1 Tax=Streptomyces sp. 2131.1 TaxID=1855346 RepID=UPI000A7B386E|nr:TIM barrel protein [Streptomyces sp. 2131.1]
MRITSHGWTSQPLFEELGTYAAERGVQVTIEPVDHWETPAPDMVRDVLDFLVGVRGPHIGVCVDSSHVVLGSSACTASGRSPTAGSPQVGRPVAALHTGEDDRTRSVMDAVLGGLRTGCGRL